MVEIQAYMADEDKDLAEAAKKAKEAYVAYEGAYMNFMQAKRQFRATQKGRGFRAPSKGLHGTTRTP